MENSFIKQEFLQLECCKCGETLMNYDDMYLVFHDRDEAIETAEIHEWEVVGELATCPDCLELNKEVI